jgi:hypothetical protein
VKRLALIPTCLALLMAVATAPAFGADALLLCGFEEVFAVSPETLAAGKLEKLWVWKAKDRSELPAAVAGRFGTTDDCKPVRNGRQILITSSGGGCALVDYPTGAVSWFAVVPNAHSIELLPNDRVVVAASTAPKGNRLSLFDLSRSETPLWETELHSAHGAVWDEARQSLWALGFAELRRYSLVDWDSKTPTLKLEQAYPLPDEGGHDLLAVPNSADLLITTHETVSLFDREAGTFRPHPALGDRAHVKSVAIHPTTAQTYFVQADRPEWWSRSLQSLTAPTRLPVEGERLYKVRWLLAPAPEAK